MFAVTSRLEERRIVYEYVRNAYTLIKTNKPTSLQSSPFKSQFDL